MRWIDALKEWNGKSGTWCIPRKGSPQHKEIRAIMDKGKEKAKNTIESFAQMKQAPKKSSKKGPKIAPKGPAPDFIEEVEPPKKLSLVEQERAEAKQRQAMRDFFAKKK
jgi:hypothetical protein